MPPKNRLDGSLGCAGNWPSFDFRLEGQNSFGDPLKAGGGGVEWHHRLDGHEFEQAPGVGDGQGRLACCSQWDHKELDMTE